MSRQRSDETIQTAEYVSIGELVRLTGVRYSTIKFYTDEGFIPYVQEDKKMVRRYNREYSIKRINEVRKMRGKGMTINQIRCIFTNS